MPYVRPMAAKFRLTDAVSRMGIVSVREHLSLLICFDTSPAGHVWSLEMVSPAIR
jgi:hypothetical protein